MGLWLLLGGRGILLIDSRGPGFALSASKSFLWRSETSIQSDPKCRPATPQGSGTPGAVASAEVSDPHTTEYSLSESKTVKNRPILGSASQLGVGGGLEVTVTGPFRFTSSLEFQSVRKTKPLKVTSEG